VSRGAEDGERALVVGTGGHVDHGKTELVRALTDVETDRWDEEKERGLSIDLGFARLPAADDRAEIGIVDVPGHEDFVTNMLAGATGVDVLLLAVAADEGPMPQTREHLSIARLLGVRRGVVALTRVDLVDDPEWIELARDAVREELRAVGVGEEWPILPVSPVTGEGMDALRRELEDAAERVPARPTDDLFRLPVDRSFSLTGTGTVATGTVWSGTVETGDELRVLPSDRRVRVRSLEVHGETREAAGAGRRCGVALSGVDPDELERGCVLVSGPGWRAVRRLGVRLRLLRHADRVVEEGQRVRVYLGTCEVMARVRLAAHRPVAPGSTGWARLDLEEPVVARAGDRFVLRFYSPVTTIGGGRVADLEPGAGGGWTEDIEAWGEIVAAETPARAVRAAVELRGGRGRSPDELPVATGIPSGRLLEEVPEPPEGVVEADGRWYPEETLRAATRDLAGELDRLHEEDRRSEGVSLEALRRAVSGRYAEGLVERALGRLAEQGEVVRSGPRIRRPGHRPELTEREQRLRERLLEAIDRGGLAPPEVGDLRSRVDGDANLLHDLLELMVSAGELVRVSPDLYLTPDSERRLRRTAAEVLREGEEPVGPGPFKEAFGVTRSYLIPLLEHLDRTGLSRRTGDGRVLADPEGGGRSAEEPGTGTAPAETSRQST